MGLSPVDEMIVKSASHSSEILEELDKDILVFMSQGAMLFLTIRGEYLGPGIPSMLFDRCLANCCPSSNSENLISKIGVYVVGNKSVPSIEFVLSLKPRPDPWSGRGVSAIAL